MNLKKLRELADAARAARLFEARNPVVFLSPQQLITLLDLVDIQYNALTLHGTSFLHHELRYAEAVEAYRTGVIEECAALFDVNPEAETFRKWVAFDVRALKKGKV
jgi:hypothetical protein